MVFGNFSDQWVRDAGGGGGHHGPNIVSARTGKFTNADTTARTLFTLPKGAILLAYEIVVTTLFNSSGTDLLAVGDGTTANRFINAQDLSATGFFDSGAPFVVTDIGTPLTAETDFKVTYTQGVADSTTGAAFFTAFYIMQ